MSIFVEVVLLIYGSSFLVKEGRVYLLVGFEVVGVEFPLQANNLELLGPPFHLLGELYLCWGINTLI
jgi:hypothetical protein